MSYVTVGGKEVASTSPTPTKATTTLSPTDLLRRSATTTTATATKATTTSTKPASRPKITAKPASSSPTNGGLMRYWPWAAGALGLVVVVAVARRGSKRESRSAA